MQCSKSWSHSPAHKIHASWACMHVSILIGYLDKYYKWTSARRRPVQQAQEPTRFRIGNCKSRWGLLLLLLFWTTSCFSHSLKSHLAVKYYGVLVPIKKEKDKSAGVRVWASKGCPTGYRVTVAFCFYLVKLVQKHWLIRLKTFVSQSTTKLCN
jgi:hypothetical protein